MIRNLQEVVRDKKKDATKTKERTEGENRQTVSEDGEKILRKIVPHLK